MAEIGKIILDDKSAMVTYTSNYQIYEIYETNAESHELLIDLAIGSTLILEEVDCNKVILIITDTIIGKIIKWKAIIKR